MIFSPSGRTGGESTFGRKCPQLLLALARASFLFLSSTCWERQLDIQRQASQPYLRSCSAGRLLGGLDGIHSTMSSAHARTRTRTHAHAHLPTMVLKGENHGGCTCACVCVCVRARVCTCWRVCAVFFYASRSLARSLLLKLTHRLGIFSLSLSFISIFLQPCLAQSLSPSVLPSLLSLSIWPALLCSSPGRRAWYL